MLAEFVSNYERKADAENWKPDIMNWCNKIILVQERSQEIGAGSNTWQYQWLALAFTLIVERE